MSYKTFPPLQAPATYNLAQIIAAGEEANVPRTTTRATSCNRRAMTERALR